MTDELVRKSRALVLETGSSDLRPSVELLREVPEEEVWLQGQRTEQTRRAYKADIRHFIEALGIRSREELRRVDRAAVIHWQRAMEAEGARPRTIRRRLSALSSLFSHLVSRRLADLNPCREVSRSPQREGRRHSAREDNMCIIFERVQDPEAEELGALSLSQGKGPDAFGTGGVPWGSRQSAE